MHQANKIFLIGFMGSGKSTIGKKLAMHFKWSFIDLDEKIENMTGMKIPEIFSEKGETFFRKIESQALETMISETNAVISTGGGTPCFGSNMDLMIRTGLTIYLKMNPEQLVKRLSESTDERPLLKDVDKKNLKGYIIRKLAEREKWYSRAEVIYDGLSDDNSELYSLIRKRIRE